MGSKSNTTIEVVKSVWSVSARDYYKIIDQIFELIDNFFGRFRKIKKLNEFYIFLKNNLGITQKYIINIKLHISLFKICNKYM